MAGVRGARGLRARPRFAILHPCYLTPAYREFVRTGDQTPPCAGTAATTRVALAEQFDQHTAPTRTAARGASGVPLGACRRRAALHGLLGEGKRSG